MNALSVSATVAGLLSCGLLVFGWNADSIWQPLYRVLASWLSGFTIAMALVLVMGLLQ
jgi:hypothetical protein